MKYSVAWAQVLNENSILKGSVIILGIAVFLFAFSTLKLALRAPLIIDRECYSNAVASSDNKHTQNEMDQFVRIALEKRFNSEAQDFRTYLSGEEAQYRMKEQEELTKKGINQKVLVNSLKIEGTNVTVDSNRILSVGKVRSALSFPLKVQLLSTERTPSNPYGLILVKVSQIQEEKK